MNEKKVSVTELGNPRKPHGDAGAEMLEGMNQRHYAVTGWALDYFNFDSSDTVLDIGCGGGETIRRIADHVSGGKVWGVTPKPPFSKDFITEFSPDRALHTRCENQ